MHTNATPQELPITILYICIYICTNKAYDGLLRTILALLCGLYRGACGDGASETGSTYPNGIPSTWIRGYVEALLSSSFWGLLQMKEFVETSDE